MGVDDDDDEDAKEEEEEEEEGEDESLGLIKDENGNPMYTISRNNYIKYEDVFKL